MPEYSENMANEYLKVIQQTPNYLNAVLEQLPEQALNLSDPAGEWRPLDILIHLNACQEIWGFTIYAMLAAENPCLTSIHPSQFAKLSYQSQVDFIQLLETFIAERRQLLSLLKILTSEEWNAAGLIAKREHSVFSQVRRLALHEKNHWDQITPFIPGGTSIIHSL
jgi:hypothetical protein